MIESDRRIPLSSRTGVIQVAGTAAAYRRALKVDRLHVLYPEVLDRASLAQARLRSAGG